MQQTPIAAAVGVELGSSTVTVAMRRGDEETEIRRFEYDAVAVVLDRIRAAREESAFAAAPTVIAVPAAWSPAQRKDLAGAGERGGLGKVEVVAAPQAAAVQYTEGLGRELGPGEALVVADLGAASFETAVVRRDEGRFAVAAHADTGEVGGDEFDQLLLAYLSGRYRDTAPEFWDSVDGEGEELRTALLAEIRGARELLSKRYRAGIPLPIGDRDLHLTRAEVESCIGGLLGQSVDLVAGTVFDARVEPAGVMLVGGAGWTPLLAEELHERTGLEPVVPDRPETALAEGALLIGLSSAEATAQIALPRKRSHRKLVVAAAVAAAGLGAAAVFGAGLGDRDRPDVDVADSATLAEPPGSSQAASEAESAGDSGGLGGQDPSGSIDESETEETSSPDGAPSPNASHPEASEPIEETATTGTVPAVTGMTAPEAKQTLSAAGYTQVALEGEREGIFGPWYDDCEVIEQNPPAEEERPFSDEVTITYSYSGSDQEACEA
ncbi:Hsp70 family protein [Glycomyces sp. NPDC046736]|uniref:Hsp70 family protein n=1 Tax=Glycomyces sp. NPDC046736 TaxID=3155615 RepID=UPI0033DEAD37